MLLVILAGIFLFSILPAMKRDKEKSEAPIPYITSEDTIERTVEEIAVKAFGRTVNWDDKPYTIKGITKYKHTAGPDEDGYLIEISYRANDNLTVSLIRVGIFSDAIEFSERLYRYSAGKGIDVYMLKPYLILIDKYGKEKEVQVAKLVLRRAIAYKVNWENFTSDMFERLLINEGQLWVHPTLNK